MSQYVDTHGIEDYIMIRCGACGTRYSSANPNCPICVGCDVRSPVIEDRGVWL